MEMHALRRKIYFDGSCRVCTAFVGSYAGGDAERHDVSARDVPEGVSHEDALKHMHVIEADGTVVRGVDAVFVLLDQHKALRWIAKVGTWWGVRAIAQMLYAAFARHRYFFNT